MKERFRLIEMTDRFIECGRGRRMLNIPTNF